MKKLLWFFIPILLFIITVTVVWTVSEKQLSQFVINRAQDLVANKTDWKLEIKRMKLSLIPPRIEITELRLSPTKDTNWISPIEIQSLQANIDLLTLLAGQIKLGIVKFSNVKTEIRIDLIPKSNDPIQTLPIKEIFETLQLFPIKMVYFEKFEVKLKGENEKSQILISSDLLLESIQQSIFYQIKTSADNQEQMDDTKLSATLVSKGELTPKNLRIHSFRITTPKSFIALEGEFLNFSKVVQKPNFSGMIDLNIIPNEINNFLKPFSVLPKDLNIDLSLLKGQIQAQGKVDINNWKKPAFDLNINLLEMGIGTYSIGSIKTQQLLFKNDKLESNSISYQHLSGSAILNHFKWNTQSDQFESGLDLKSLDLQKLFQSLSLTGIPVELALLGSGQCDGSLYKNFQINCKASATGNNLDVRSQYHGPPPPIIALSNINAEGTVSINLKEVRYDANIKLNHSEGSSQGTVNYSTGFIIDFKSDRFSFKDVPAIAGLQFEGNGKLQGRTQGDSHSATLDIDLAVDNLWFEKYGIGNLKGKLNYKKGHLLIESNEAKLNNSLYNAKIDIDLSHSRINGLVDFSQVDAQDAIFALSNRVPIPFTANGLGRARAQFEGPFQLGGLSYQFEGYLNKGDIQGETFDEIKWNWSAKNGNVLINNNTLQKGTALIRVDGTSDPLGNLDLNVEGNNFKLEHSTFLSKFVKTLGGDINFKMSVKNHILKPDIILKGNINHTTLGDSELPNSKFDFNTDSTGLFVNLDLLGKRILMNLKLPYEKKESAQLSLEIQKFNYADFLALIFSSPLRSDYNSMLSLKMNIQSPNNNIFDASGDLRIDELYLARNNQFLKNEKPMFIYFNNGSATFKDFALNSPQSQIQFIGDDFTPQKLKVLLKVSTDLKLYQLFTPFIDDISGPVSGEIRLGGSLSSPEIYGNIDIKDITFKIKGFSPLFDHISSHLEFSQKRIIIEPIRGSFAGGSVVGDGTILINGARDIRVDLKTQLRNIRLEVPEHVQTSGVADIVISGNWFPYVISGNYRVNQALIDKEFNEENTMSSVRQSIYLPKNISKSEFDPVVLDLQLYLDRKIEIKNSQISGFLNGQLQIKGPPQNPILLGSIKTLPQAQLFFRDKVFDIQSGQVKFSDPTEINPELYFTARSTVEKYEVNLMLQGNAKNPQLSLSSQPPLEQQEIISLLALGVTTQTLDNQIQSSQQATQMGNQLGAAIISANPLNKEIKQSLGVDVKFSSDYDDTKSETINKFTATKEIIPRKLKASASISENQKNFRFQYLLSDRLSSVLTYEENESQSGTAVGSGVGTSANKTDSSIFGIDLEYKMEFK